jgi:hypothetical protein
MALDVLCDLPEAISMLAILIGGLFAFMFGGMLLMLFFGARGIEDELNERARETREIRKQAARIPRFLAVTHPAIAQIGRVDERLLSQLQQYMEAEQTLANEFVLQPSIESLYRESGRKPISH